MRNISSSSNSPTEKRLPTKIVLRTKNVNTPSTTTSTGVMGERSLFTLHNNSLDNRSSSQSSNLSGDAIPDNSETTNIPTANAIPRQLTAQKNQPSFVQPTMLTEDIRTQLLQSKTNLWNTSTIQQSRLQNVQNVQQCRTNTNIIPQDTTTTQQTEDLLPSAATINITSSLQQAQQHSLNQQDRQQTSNNPQGSASMARMHASSLSASGSASNKIADVEKDADIETRPASNPPASDNDPIFRTFMKAINEKLNECDRQIQSFSLEPPRTPFGQLPDKTREFFPWIPKMVPPLSIVPLSEKLIFIRERVPELHTLMEHLFGFARHHTLYEINAYVTRLEQLPGNTWENLEEFTSKLPEKIRPFVKNFREAFFAAVKKWKQLNKHANKAFGWTHYGVKKISNPLKIAQKFAFDYVDDGDKSDIDELMERIHELISKSILKKRLRAAASNPLLHCITGEMSLVRFVLCCCNGNIGVMLLLLTLEGLLFLIVDVATLLSEVTCGFVGCTCIP